MMMEECSPIYVITGGPGFGKTTLVDYLKNLGFKTGDEVARAIINEQRRIGGDVLPEKNIRVFQRAVLNRRVAFYQSVGNNEIAFSDRGIPDQLAFARYKRFGAPDVLVQYAREFSYNKIVFVTPPWEEIYQNDATRNENFAQASELHHIIVDVYEELGYSVITLPCVEVKQRAEFILNQIR